MNKEDGENNNENFMPGIFGKETKTKEISELSCQNI